MKIYTGTGDDGTTGLVGGARVRKTDIRIEAIGAVDELNAITGLCRVGLAEESLMAPVLNRAQSLLFDLGAELASPQEEGSRYAAIDENDNFFIESSIDQLTESLEPLRNFVLPGGTELASRLHVARTACRRAEREVLRLHELFPISEQSRKYLNRLSDWLFTAARFANHEAGVPDVPWNAKPKSTL